MRGWLVEAPGEISWRDDLPQPSASEGLIGIDVVAAAVNFADSLVVGGTYQTIPPYPFTPGLEVLGRVTSPSAGGFEEGQMVVGLTTAGGGSWAEYALCDPRQVVAVPDSVDPRDALAVHRLDPMDSPAVARLLATRARARGEASLAAELSSRRP